MGAFGCTFCLLSTLKDELSDLSGLCFASIRQGYCRGVRTGSRISIAGTTASSPVPLLLPLVGLDSAASQTIHIFDIASRALGRLYGSLRDVVRTRIFLVDLADTDAVCREHGRIWRDEGVRPANTLVQVAGLVGRFKVEIEFEAEVGGRGVVLNI